MEKFIIQGIVGAYSLPINLSKEAIKGGIVLVVDTTEEECTITLPPVATYDVTVTVIDLQLNALVNNINIGISDPSQFFEGGSETVTISSNGGVININPIGNELYSIDGLAAYEDTRYITSIVNVSAADILDMHNTPVELLPALGSAKYYDIQSAIFEVSAGAAYVIPAQDSVVTGFGNLSISAFDGTDAYVIKMNPVGLHDNTGQSVVEADAMGLGVASGFYMTGSDGDAWTTGTKTVRVIIKFAVRTFGS